MTSHPLSGPGIEEGSAGLTTPENARARGSRLSMASGLEGDPAGRAFARWRRTFAVSGRGRVLS